MPFLSELGVWACVVEDWRWCWAESRCNHARRTSAAILGRVSESYDANTLADLNSQDSLSTTSKSTSRVTDQMAKSSAHLLDFFSMGILQRTGSSTPV